MIHHGIEYMSVEEEEAFTAGLADCLPASSEGSIVPCGGVDEVAIVPSSEHGALCEVDVHVYAWWCAVVVNGVTAIAIVLTRH